MATLKRVNLNLDEAMIDSRRELLNEASEVLLGHTKDRPQATDLLVALKRLDFRPLESESVRKYKASKQKTWKSYELGDRLFQILWVICTSLFLICVGDMIRTKSTPQIEGVLSFVTGLCIVYLSMYLCDVDPTIHTRSWHSTSLESYGIENIPDFVIAKAVELKKMAPGVSFNVEYLSEILTRHEPARFSNDPFLVANMGSDSVFLDVWDEKDFERKI